MTNWEHYFGAPEVAAKMEVEWLCFPVRVLVYEVRKMSKFTTSSQLVRSFDSGYEYLAWLSEEYDDGTIVFED